MLKFRFFATIALFQLLGIIVKLVILLEDPNIHPGRFVVLPIIYLIFIVFTIVTSEKTGYRCILPDFWT